VIEPSWTDFHVSYRMGSRHALDQGAAGKAILAGRRKPDPAGRPFVVTSGELQAGAQGVSSPVLGVPGVEASIGVVVLGKLDRDFVGPRVARAAVEVAKRLA
jgi:DNA-binding IclR family transcriptional regulator